MLAICGQLGLDISKNIRNKREHKTYVAVELKVVGDAVGASTVDILGDDKSFDLDRALPL